ncbi:uncharacterized protein LOC106777460 isoform X1 [Vigna radiata var. radiata]|uniref:Uncharacterized protein LOC106777460 isoform X1 n=1 Tax=Vigna radiata var. radiata TaxID=3916 RepID=A0A1S3VQ66_VIGRR|nr:uncharacterized protein LOC106777460 isoform X1 [Vigna radiata var. radiata]
MACLDMYNNSEHKRDANHHHHHHHHHHQCAPMSPRISFSNDFVDVQQAMKQQEQRGSRSDAPAVSSDFEFSVTNYSMMSADELFFKGRLLSYKDNCNNHMMQQRATTTLKEELLTNDDEYDQGFSLRPPKASSTRWKGLLGLRKTHIGSKKPHKTTEPSSEPRSALLNEAPPINVTSSEEQLHEGGSKYGPYGVGDSVEYL